MTIDEFLASPRGQAVVEAAARASWAADGVPLDLTTDVELMTDYLAATRVMLRAALAFDDGQGPHPFLDVLAEEVGWRDEAGYLWSSNPDGNVEALYVPRQPREGTE